MALKALDDTGTRGLVGADHIVEVFWAQLLGEGGRVCQVTKHHRELTAFGLGPPWHGRWRVPRRRLGGLDDRWRVRLGRARRPRRSGEGSTAGGAKVRLRPMLRATAWTMRPQWCPTAAAKPAPCGMVCMIDVLAYRTAPGLPARQRARDHHGLRCRTGVGHLARGMLQRLRRPRGARMRLIFILLARRGLYRDGCYEAIAVTVERLNDALRLPTIAYGPAYRPQGTLQRRVTDALRRPHLFAQFLFVHDALAVRQQVE